MIKNEEVQLKFDGQGITFEGKLEKINQIINKMIFIRLIILLIYFKM